MGGTKMNLNEEFLLSKINNLEKQLFELEKRVKDIEARNVVFTELVNNETILAPENKPNTRIERYLFDGKDYKKSKLVLAVIKKYVSDHPDINAEELDAAFPRFEFKLGSFSCVKKFDEIPPNYLHPVKRYFIDEDQLIVLADGTKMAVCTQWGANIAYFIEFVKRYGYQIKKIEQN